MGKLTDLFRRLRPNSLNSQIGGAIQHMISNGAGHHMTLDELSNFARRPMPPDPTRILLPKPTDTKNKIII